MKNYNKQVPLQCTTCGDTEFEFNDDKSYVKCKRCGREYLGGYDELVRLNKDKINSEVDKAKKEIRKDFENELVERLKKTFKGSKNIKFK